MKGSQIHFWAKMGLGKFGWGKNGTGQIWVGANLALGKFGFRANLAGQNWSGQTWPGKLGLGKNGLTPSQQLQMFVNSILWMHHFVNVKSYVVI